MADKENVPTPQAIHHAASLEDIDMDTEPAVPPEPQPAEQPAGGSERALNVTDALSYLDSVKLQFHEQPDVYNKFLDIMKEFKSQVIDTPGVIQRVSHLFHGHPALIQGFNTFLPAGYRIECTTDAKNPNHITVTTPAGTTTHATDSVFTFHEGPSTAPQRVPAPPQAPTPAPAVSTVPNVDLEPALLFVQHVKARYLHEPQRYLKFHQILSEYSTTSAEVPDSNRESWSVAVLSARCVQGDVVARVGRLFEDSLDLMREFVEFLPDQRMREAELVRLADAEEALRVATPEAKAAKKKADASGSTLPQKRKRKVVDKDRERERERDREREKEKDVGPSAKASGSKLKKARSQVEPPSPRHAPVPASPRRSHAQPHHQQLPPPSMPPPIPVATSIMNPADSAHFFDRVKRALDSRETYNEFLKVINQFTQDIIHLPRLVREAHFFLGDSELFAQFREIVGWDERKEHFSNVDDFWTRPVAALDRPSRNQLNLRYGSYRKLPANEVNVVCSGRDEMCKSVLNDEWISQPTFASEDTGFFTHRKNVYEEALHRSEEERHEYDFHIEAIHRTIQLLEPLNNKIGQMSGEERAVWKLKSNFSGAGKAIHLRVIKKIYGRDAGVDVYHAMQENPVHAIPLVLERLKQKHEQWKRAQREWNKVWREVDAHNYHKSLDHQGITFKTTDKKMIAPKALVNQIEVARDEQMAKRAALIDPLFARTRPRHQLEFVVEDEAVLQDVLKLTLAFLDRTQGQINFGDRKKIETFFRTFIPLFFALDAASFNNALMPRHESTDSDMDVDSVLDDTELSGASSSRGKVSKKSTAGDLRKKLLKAEQAKSSRRTRAQSAASSRRTSPAPSDTMQIETEEASAASVKESDAAMSLSPTELQPSRRRRSYIFFTNTNFYVFVRLLELLYSRLHLFKQLAAEIAGGLSTSQKPNPVATKLGIMNDMSKVESQPSDALHFYDLMLESCEKLFDNEIEQHGFEDQLRYMFGTRHGYKMFTVDKVVGALVKIVQNVLGDPKSQELYDILRREREIPHPTTQDQLNSRCNSEKVIGPDENLFRVDWISESKTITMQLIGKDDSSIDDAEIVTGRWQVYVESFVSPEPTVGVSPLPVRRRPFLGRTKLPVSPEDGQPDVVARGGLGIKICVRTYRLFFEHHSEDVLFRKPSVQEKEVGSRRLEAAKTRRKKWVDKLAAPTREADEPPAVTSTSQPTETATGVAA